MLEVKSCTVHYYRCQILSFFCTAPNIWYFELKFYTYLDRNIVYNNDFFPDFLNLWITGFEFFKNWDTCSSVYTDGFRFMYPHIFSIFLKLQSILLKKIPRALDLRSQNTLFLSFFVSIFIPNNKEAQLCAKKIVNNIFWTILPSTKSHNTTKCHSTGSLVFHRVPPPHRHHADPSTAQASLHQERTSRSGTRPQEFAAPSHWVEVSHLIPFDVAYTGGGATGGTQSLSLASPVWPPD
jgi:hypothetical protein